MTTLKTFPHSAFCPAAADGQAVAPNRSDSPYFVLLDNADSGRAVWLEEHAARETLRADEIQTLDERLKAGWARGLHAFLVLPYAAGHGWQKLSARPDTTAADTEISIDWFAQKTEMPTDEALRRLCGLAGSAPAGVSDVHNDTSETDYLRAIGDVQAAIARGDTYQINYTTRLNFTAYGDPRRLYLRLRERQSVPYGALACLPQHRQPEAQWILCFSPELFLEMDGQGGILTKPMKGTAPIMRDGLDAQRARQLQNDTKNRAENVMIVDLLRNDLGKIAQTGSVRVPESFAVRAHGRVWQMTSTVAARLPETVGLSDVLRATFPCGSITGAPKRMSMSLIDQLETNARGLYTGSLGHIEPAGGAPGCRGWLNVLIRTVHLRAQAGSADAWRGEMGVGSGIVADSDGAGEYEECGWKSRFLTGLPPEFGLIETLRFDDGRCELWPLHQERLRRAMRVLGFSDSRTAQQIETALADVPRQGRYRVRLAVQPDGTVDCTAAPLTALPEKIGLIVHPDNRIDSGFLARFKTTHRAVYDAAWRAADALGAFDTLLFDRDGFLLEGGRSNVFVRIDGEWHTPSLQRPLLNGVMRQAVLSAPQRYLNTACVHETPLHWRDVQTAEAWVLTNALRGVLTVTDCRCEKVDLQAV